jgi:hypothetical protein
MYICIESSVLMTGVNILYTKTNKELEPKQNAEMKRKVNLI